MEKIGQTLNHLGRSGRVVAEELMQAILADSDVADFIAVH